MNLSMGFWKFFLGASIPGTNMPDGGAGNDIKAGAANNVF